jgi:hypothetical protein
MQQVTPAANRSAAFLERLNLLGLLQADDPCAG